jgi:uncharacterized repeat protein (TIGR03809 family)
MDVAYGRDVVARGCALAEQRLEYLTELFETGRWRRYHSELAFLENIQEAKTAVEVWRGLSAPKARDNPVIDLSRLGHTAGPSLRETTLSDQAHRPQSGPGQVASELTSHEVSIVPETRHVNWDQAPSAPVMDTTVMEPASQNASELTLDIAVMQERYPLLRNAL